MSRVTARYEPNRAGLALCAVGPELRQAVSHVAHVAMDYAVAISPTEPREYAGSFEVLVEIVPDIDYRQRGEPMARWAGILINQSPKAVLVEVGSSDRFEARVLTHTLQWLAAGANL